MVRGQTLASLAISGSEGILEDVEEDDDETNANSQVLELVLQGRLWKKGSRRSNWNERNFVLSTNPAKLAYYKGAESAGVAGQVDFGGGAEVQLQQVIGAKKKGKSGSTEWRFRVASGKESLLMAANSETEMGEWLAALSSVLGVAVEQVEVE